MTLRNNRKESSGYKVKLQNWTKVISLLFGILHFYIENCKWNIGTIPILVLESQFPNPTHSPTLTASPTPFPLFYEEPRAEGWRAWGPILPPGLCVRHRCSRIEIAGPVFLWLDLGLCDFLQWQRTEWRVMLEISGRGFLLHSQMDLEDHSTTPSNISEISEMIRCFGVKTTKSLHWQGFHEMILWSMRHSGIQSTAP